MRIVAVGASGHAGTAIAQLLAPSLGANDQLVLAGRNSARLDQVRGQLSTSADVTTSIVDVADTSAFAELVAGADLVVTTASRPDLVPALARIVLDAGADWFDTMLSVPAKLSALRKLEPEIAAAGRCFITDGGFHPGLPAALVRWAGDQLDDLVEADVMAGLKVDWMAETVADSTIEEMLTEFADFQMVSYVDGERRALRWAECPTVEFDQPIGRQLVVPMSLAEMDDLPARYPSLRRCGFYISGFGPAMDYLMLPLLMVMARIRPLHRATVRLTRWSMARLASTPPPHRLEIRTTARGTRAGRPALASAKISGEDGYLLTAAPAVACLRRVLDGSIRTPGLHLQADLVEPGPFLHDLVGLGVKVETSVSPVH